MKRPAFQWYPGDFRRDTGVQACTFEARALWREMLDLMHDGEPRGYLNAGGAPITPDALARIVGVPAAKVKRWLAELEERHVFSRSEDGVIYSRRMVRDEHVANARAAGGGLSLNNPNVPRPKKGGRKGRTKDGGKDTFRPSLDSTSGGSPAVAVASAGTTTPVVPVHGDEPDRFEEFWAVYPRRSGTNPKHGAETQWKRRLRDGATADEIIAGAQRYRELMETTGKIGTEYVMQAVRFLGKDKHFEDDHAPPPAESNGDHRAHSATGQGRGLSASERMVW